MGNNIYAIPIKKLFDEKDDPTMDSFTADLDIDLNNEIACKYPTVLDLKAAIKNAGLEITAEQDKNSQEQEGWCCGIKEPEGFDSHISADNINAHDELITDILSFPEAKWETALKLLFELESDWANLVLLRFRTNGND